ncbi:hypothetical protein ACFO9Q_20910 [Paenibacillus sp. GCM10023252]|uniref:hypothetical protein n=1 Tax=Paenibacillus sp. GCM10023252 TaxID=3252649 RepID=UPI003606D106
MVVNQKQMPMRQGETDEPKNALRSYVEGAEARDYQVRKHERPSGTHQYMDEQNKMIDKVNLRK